MAREWYLNCHPAFDEFQQCGYMRIYYVCNMWMLYHSEASQFNVPIKWHISNKVVLGRFPYSDTPTFCTTMWLAALCSGSLISLPLARLQKHVAISMSRKESQYRITCKEQLKQMVEHPPFKFHSVPSSQCTTSLRPTWSRSVRSKRPLSKGRTPDCVAWEHVL